MNEIKCEVTKSIHVFIKAKNKAVNLNEPLYAVNWFSSKRAWVYHLYNKLASRSVQKIGGKGFFKGKVTKTILDQNNSRRDLILIVHYPNAISFKNLMENTYFKIVSLLRMAAVKDFSFGFTHKKDVSDSSLNENLHYLIHHFKTDNEAIYERFNEFLSEDIGIKYSGKMVAELYTEKENRITRVPNIIDGIVIYESKTETSILDMVAKKEYQEFIKTLDSSFIGTIKRIL